MSILTSNFKQAVTHWDRGAPDGFGGFAFAAPVKIIARWEERAEIITDDFGNEFTSNARVFLPIDVKIGNYLFLGISTATDPRNIEGAFEVKQFRKLPDLFDSLYERRALL